MWHPSPKFPQCLLAAPISEKLEYFSEKFLINHQILEDCESEIKRVLFKNRQYQIVNIFGPTGVGKSELAKHIEKLAFDIFSHEHQKENEFVGLPAVYVEVVLQGDTTFDWKSFYTEVLRAMNAPPERLCKSIKIPECSAKGRGYSEGNRKLGEIRKALEDRIKELKLRVLILDETQHFFMFSAKNKEATLEILKSIANRTKCQIILVGTYQSLKEFSWSGQLTRRIKKIHFRRYSWVKESQIYAASYMGLLSHIPHELHDDLFDFNTVKYLYKVSCGCIGILKQLLERALDRNQFERPLRFSDLKQEVLNVKDLIRIAKEIKEGEEFFESEPLSKLEDLLGVSSKKNDKNEALPKNANKKRPGVRKPARDKVGMNG